MTAAAGGPPRISSPIAVAFGLVILALVALLDYLTPASVNFGLIYMLAVLAVAWASGARAGIVIALLASLLEGANARLVHEDPLSVELWNGLSRFAVLSALAVITDQLRKRQEDLRRVDGERRTLLRLLEREFPRPLRALDWFSRMLDESLERGLLDAAQRQIKPLRHHIQEASFLATDLLSVGSLHSGALTFARVELDLGQILNEAAEATPDRGRILVDLAEIPLIVLGDPDRLRHAIASVLGRSAQTPSMPVSVFVRAIGSDGLVNISTVEQLTADDLELARLLVEGCGGRLTVAPRSNNRGVAVSIWVPRAVLADEATAATTSALSSQA